MENQHRNDKRVKLLRWTRNCIFDYNSSFAILRSDIILLKLESNGKPCQNVYFSSKGFRIMFGRLEFTCRISCFCASELNAGQGKPFSVPSIVGILYEISDSWNSLGTFKCKNIYKQRMGGGGTYSDVANFVQMSTISFETSVSMAFNCRGLKTFSLNRLVNSSPWVTPNFLVHSLYKLLNEYSFW